MCRPGEHHQHYWCSLMWNTREEHGGVGAQNGCKQGKWHLTSCNLWTSFQRQETHHFYSGRVGRIRHKDPGIRGTIHRMLVHQSHTETKKKGKEKAVTSKSKHDEQCRERETKRETGSVCIYVSERERESFAGWLCPKQARDGGLRRGRPLDTGVLSSSQRILNHTNTHTHTYRHTHTVWGRDAIKENTIGLEFSFPNPI